ncbi:MAG TPA: DNA primase [Burkholderiaceae bacterium]|nr:DNA primase [Burkholderiaceae bacterium]
MIPQGFIQDLLARVDIVDVVGRYVQLKKGGQNYLGLCPFHSEKSPSFTVSPSKQFFHCFGCGAHGSAIGFVMEHRGESYVDAIRDLAQTVGMQVPVTERAAESHSKTRELADVLSRASDFYRVQLKDSVTAIEYLKRRGITGQTAARFALGYAPDAWQPLRAAFANYDDPRLVESGLVIADEGKRYDRFRGRVMFPIRSARGQVIGFGARVIDAGEPKYLNSPETLLFRKGHELYGLHEARDAIRRTGRAIVAEGYMDVIRLAQAGFDESVAALGTAVTSAHVSALFKAADHVIFAFDGDAAGRKAARRALEAALPVIADTKRASFVSLPEGQDPDSVIADRGAAGFESALNEALPLSEFFIRALTGLSDRRSASAEDRAAWLGAGKPLLLSMVPGAMRLQLVRELAEAARTPLDAVEALYGLRKAPPRRTGVERHTPRMEVGDLKLGILQQLLAHPMLAREFNQEVIDEHLHGGDRIDRQITEVWRASTATTASEAAVLSHGGLLEMLAESEYDEEYRALAAQEMEIETGVEVARCIVSDAFSKLKLRRFERERSERLADYERDPSPQRLDAYRAADQAYTRAREPTEQTTAAG